jgi:C-terminal processing protease CtpA/Prc
MVGRLRDGRLILQAIGSSPDWPRLVEKVNIRVPLALVLQNDPYLPTDTHEFYPSGVPVISFFTDVHDDYNRPTDDADTLNYAGMEHIARFARHMVTELAAQPDRLEHANVQRAIPKGGEMRGRRIYTGTVPDFAAGDVGGMKISGVQGGSPAEKAGLTGGDVIIKFAGHDIGGLEDYAVVLRALKADEPVEIVVKRNGEEVKLTITPTVRK